MLLRTTFRTIECLRSNRVIMRGNELTAAYFRWRFRCMRVTTIAMIKMIMAVGMAALLNRVFRSVIVAEQPSQAKWSYMRTVYKGKYTLSTHKHLLIKREQESMLPQHSHKMRL